MKLWRSIMSSLIEQLSTKSTKLSNTDSAWALFINDHIPLIKTKCITVIIDDVIRDRYIYKFDHFLRDNVIRADISWIAKLINDLTMYDDFTLRSYILLPDITQIENLYRQYRTSRNKVTS